jgi:hypothetical protein
MEAYFQVQNEKKLFAVQQNYVNHLDAWLSNVSLLE